MSMPSFPVLARLVQAAGLAFALAIGAIEPAAAQGILKKAPAQGILWNGEIVFVDDGSCPPGQIKMVTGAGRKQNEIVLDATPRDRHECIVRPRS